LSVPRPTRIEQGVHWRLLIDGPADGAANMAADESLFESVRAGGQPVLRLYRWQPSCLSLGRNQAAAVYDRARAASRGIDMVRRPTGGLAVYHHRELTYAVLAPVSWRGRPRAAYRAIHAAIACGLRTLGVPAHSLSARVSAPAAVAGSVPAALPSRHAPHPCFQDTVDGEVAVAGRKLVGSAQRCEGRTLLQHGSILLHDDQTVVNQLQRTPGFVSTPAAIGLDEVLGEAPSCERLAQAIVDGFAADCGIVFRTDALSAAEQRRAHILRERYRSEAWTGRK
jgi:lipoate-protein ligase A